MFQKLDENDQEILLGQKDIIARIHDVNLKMERAQETLNSIQVQIEEEFLIDFYKLDLKDIIDVIDLFPTLSREESGVIIVNSRFETFIDLIIGKFRVEKAAKNIHKMMIGQDLLPFKKSLYEIKDTQFCKPEVHQKLMFLAAEGMKYLLFASRHVSMDMKLASDQYEERRVKADEAYVVHCGCPEGYQPYQIKVLSDLIPSLPPSSDPLFMNMADIRIHGRTAMQVEKATMLINYKNFKPTREVILAIDEFTLNDIQRAIQLTKQDRTHWLKYYDGRKSCMQKNYVNFKGNSL